MGAGPHRDEGRLGRTEGMEAFIEQSVVLVVLAYVAGLGCAGLVVGLTSRRRREEWRAAMTAARRRPVTADRPAQPPAAGPFGGVALPEPLLAGSPAFELLDAPRTRREARGRR